MQQLITGFVVYIQLNTFRASSCPSSGVYQLQQQPLVYRRNVVVAVLLAVVGPGEPTTANSTVTTTGSENTYISFLGFVCPRIFTHSNESTN